MISHRHSFIYIHVPKTGGNAIQSVLLPLSDDGKVVRGHQDGIDRFEVEGDITPRKHARLEDYVGRVDLDRFTVAVSCRNPIERLISYYFSPHRWYERDERAWSFTEPCWDRDDFLACVPQIVRAVDFMRVGGIVRPADALLRFETLSASLGGFLSRIGAPAADDPPLVNVGKTRPSEIARARSDRTLLEIARTHFREDFEVYGYDLPSDASARSGFRS